jgi:gamma-glutamylaminecyclotransferase
MLLFFYGTLKSGGSANHFLAGARLVGPAVTAPKYRLYDMGWHPAMVRDDANGVAVEGEVWDVPATMIPALDDYESEPEGFVRKWIEVSGIVGEVQAYLYAKPVPPDRPSAKSWPYV